MRAWFARQPPALRVALIYAALLALALALGGLLSVTLDTAVWMHPHDFNHIRDGSRYLLQGEAGYTLTWLFAPPWVVLTLLPFVYLPQYHAELAWQLLMVFLSLLIPALAAQIAPEGQRRGGWLWAMPLFVAAPYTLYGHITGQIVLIVVAGLLLVLWGVQRDDPWLTLLGVYAASLKPHIVALPVALLLFEALRRQQWRTLAITLGGMLALALASFALRPAWPLEWIEALTSGRYLEPRGHILSLHTFGLPVWVEGVLIVLVMAAWWHWRVSVWTVGVAVIGGLLALPYLRGYDFPLLLIPLLLTAPTLARARLRWAWAGITLATFSLTAIGPLLLQTSIEAFAPVVALVGTLILASRAPLHRDPPVAPAA